MKKQNNLLFALLFMVPSFAMASVLLNNDATVLSPKVEKRTSLGDKINNWFIKRIEKKLLGTTNANCDLIYLQDGNEISAKVSEITDTEIKYKKCSNLDGPNITISKSKIWKIKYANGEIDIINKLGSTGGDDNKSSTSSSSNNSNSGNAQKTDGTALAGMITGIASLVLGFSIIGLACGVVGIILSVIGLRKINNDPKRLKGKGLAKAGLICGIIGCGLYVLLLL
jgi:Domain of unknown function (DUF4190)